MNALNVSWKNILAKPLNSFMSVLLFALSVGLITMLLLFNDQFKKGLDNNLAGIDLVIGAKGSPLQLILNSMYHIDAPTGNISLEKAAPFLNPAHPLIATSIPLSLGDSYAGYRIAGAPQKIFLLYRASEIKGSVYKEDFEVVIGSTVAEKTKLDVGDHFFSTHGLEENPDLMHDHGSPFVVSGILKETGTVLDQLILCTPRTIWKVHEHDSVTAGDHAHEIAKPGRLSFTKIDSSELVSLNDSVVSDLRSNPDKDITSILIRYRNRTNIQSLNLLRNINQNTDLMAASPPYEINRLYAMMGSGYDALRYLAGLIGIVAALSIFISLYSSLKERRYEIAVMRVNGATPAKILMMILGEGLLISVLGLVVGFALGHLGMTMAGDILHNAYHYRFTGLIFLKEELFVILAGFFLGIVASIIPAIQGSRVDLHKTLAAN